MNNVLLLKLLAAINGIALCDDDAQNLLASGSPPDWLDKKVAECFGLFAQSNDYEHAAGVYFDGEQYVVEFDGKEIGRYHTYEEAESAVRRMLEEAKSG